MNLFKGDDLTLYTCTVGSDKVDTSGYQTITNTGTLGTFGPLVVAAIPTQSDYELDVLVDVENTAAVWQLANIDINVGDDWNDVAAAIETSLQAASDTSPTVAIVDGEIVITSATEGGASAISIAAGTAGTGSGDLLGVIDLIGGASANTTNIVDAVDGEEGAILVSLPIASSIHEDAVFGFVASIQTSAGLNKAGIKYSYNTTTGVLTITDNAGTTELLENDILTFIGGFAYASESV